MHRFASGTGFVTVLGLVLGAQPCIAQSAFRPAAGVAFERYGFDRPESFGIKSLSLLTVPFGAAADLGGRVTLSLAGAWASGTLERVGARDGSLSGLTDTELSARFGTAGGALVLTTTVLLPVGDNRLTDDELLVAGAIAADLLPFNISNWATGGGAGAAVAVARPLGAFALGASAGCVAARSYAPLASDEFEYRPGNQLHVRAAMDRLIGAASKWSLQLTWQRFSADRADGRNIFQPGDRARVVSSLDFPIAGASAVVYAGWLARSQGEFADPADLLPAQRMVYSGFVMRQAIGHAVLQPVVELRLVDTDGPGGHGYTAGLGTSAEMSRRATQFVPSARVRFGRIEGRDGAHSTFQGIQLGMTVRPGLGVL